MKIHHFLSVVFIFLLIYQANAQVDLKISRSDFKKGDTGFKRAWQAIKAGDDYFSKGRGEYRNALKEYLVAHKYNSENPELNYKIGICYLNSLYKEKAIEYFRDAYHAKKDVAYDILYWLARAYHYNYEFDKAIQNYRAYQKSLSPREYKEQKPFIDRLAEQCNNGKELVKNPLRVYIDNAGENINSLYMDYSPLISADESMMIFTSRRPNTTGGKKNPDGTYREDVYVSYKIDGKWQEAANMGEPINTENNDATVGLSPDGQELFIYNGLMNGGDILVCRLHGDKWSEPEPLPRTVNTKYKEASASFSPDGNTMYFASKRTDVNFGGSDLFRCTKNKRNKWDHVINLGNVINTPYNEMGVFMHPDGRTLYFSSQGHNSMGGYDIFKSVQSDDGTWSEPENLGYPINTPKDDVFFVMAASGRHAYYFSHRDDSYGDRDIYRISFLHPEKLILSNEDNLIASIAHSVSEDQPDQSELSEKNTENAARLTLLSGTVTDSATSKPIGATIEITDNKLNEVISTFTSNSKTGNYLISLPSGKNYGVAVKADGYLFYSQNINIPETSTYQEITKHIKLQKISVGAKVVLDNIFFDTGKSDLRDESFGELNQLIKLMNENPSIKVEISGHTDNRGSYENNKKLSKDRAKAVVDYLIKNGIDKDRLTYKGYSYSQPIADNETEEGRQKNRRVEFMITGE